MSARQIQAQPERTHVPHQRARSRRETEPKDSRKPTMGSANLCPSQIFGNPAPVPATCSRRLRSGAVRKPSGNRSPQTAIANRRHNGRSTPAACIPTSISSLPAGISTIATGISGLPMGTFLVPTLTSRMSRRSSNLPTPTFRIPTPISSIPTGISTLPMASFAHRTRIPTLPTPISNSKPPFATPRLPVVTSFFSLAPTGRADRGEEAAFIPHSAPPLPHFPLPISDLPTPIS